MNPLRLANIGLLRTSEKLVLAETNSKIHFLREKYLKCSAAVRAFFFLQTDNNQPNG